jgi:hypothetical protein
LLERKRILRKLVPPQPSPILYVDHVVASGGALYSAVCLRDTEVAKLGNGTHTPDATTWSRSRIPTIAKRRGRADFFQAGA